MKIIIADDGFKIAEFDIPNTASLDARYGAGDVHAVVESLMQTLPHVVEDLPYTAQFLLHHTWSKPPSRNRRRGRILRELVAKGVVPLEAQSAGSGKLITYYLK